MKISPSAFRTRHTDNYPLISPRWWTLIPYRENSCWHFATDFLPVLAADVLRAQYNVARLWNCAWSEISNWNPINRFSDCNLIFTNLISKYPHFIVGFINRTWKKSCVGRRASYCVYSLGLIQGSPVLAAAMPHHLYLGPYAKEIRAFLDTQEANSIIRCQWMEMLVR